MATDEETPQQDARVLVVAILLLLGAGLLFAVWRSPQTLVVIAAPSVFSGPVNGGCYLDTATTCKLHIDSWTPIQVSQGEQLLAFQLRAAGELLYDFRTDASNPPGGIYYPSLVKKDFAISCGENYVLSVLAQDTGDASLVTIGQTNSFSCPAAATPTPVATGTPDPPAGQFRILLPVVVRQGVRGRVAGGPE